MQRIHGTVQDPQGNIKSSGQINVYDRGTLNLVNIYTDRAGTIPVSPVGTAESNTLGMFNFCVADGIYDIKISHADIVDQWLYEVHAKDVGYRTIQKGLTILSPVVGNDIDLYYFNNAATIEKIVVRTQVGTSVEWNLVHGAAYGTGDNVLLANEVTAAGSSYTVVNSGFDVNSAVASTGLWLNIVAVTGSPDWFFIDFKATEDEGY